MEKVKEPAMVLSIVNSVALVGTIGYFYKQMQEDRQNMQKIAQTLSGVVRKLTDIEKGEQNKGEALHTLNDEVKRLNQALTELPTFEALDNLDVDMDEIITMLNENNISVERPSLIPKKRTNRRGDSRNDSRGDSRNDLRSDSRNSQRNDNRRVSREDEDSDREEDTRAVERPTNRNKNSQNNNNNRNSAPRQKNNPKLDTNYDDTGLIDQVRSLQKQ